MLPQSPFIGGSYFVPWTRRNFDVMVRKEPNVVSIVTPGEAAMINHLHQHYKIFKENLPILQ